MLLVRLWWKGQHEYGVFLFCDKIILEVGESVRDERFWPPKPVSMRAE